MRGLMAGLLAVSGACFAGAAEVTPTPIGKAYAATAARIVGAELVSGKAYEILSHLTDRIGPRLSGSTRAEEAVRWTIGRLRADGLDARAERVMVPHWIRGAEEAEIVAPVSQRLVATALGGSDPTPEAGMTADVVEVSSFDELKALGEARVRGRIVLFNKAITAAGMGGYGAVSPLRTKGAVEAARLGAVASLVRSLGTYSLRIPHTGAMDYDPGVPRIPAAAVTAEDGDLIHRLLVSGDPVRLRLRLTCRTLPDVESANVVADLRGREKPDEIVVLGAHLDSWDLATGAIDDGAGVAMVMETLRLLKSLGLTPRRTVRGVLFMNEENGLRGAKAYAQAHAGELEKHVAALECDSGAARPQGFDVWAGPGGLETAGAIAGLLKTMGADTVTAGSGEADISEMKGASVPLLGLSVDATHYFDWHHSAADTLDKVKPEELASGAAAVAVMAYVLADMPEALPRPEPARP